MIVLALDTTTRAGSVALVIDDRVVDERQGDDARSHAERLPAELLALASANDVGIGDVDLFAVASGPGSFTGLRIGIATIQGLALVTHRPIVAISALDALADVAAIDAEPETTVAAWMDAHRRDVFAALYSVDGARTQMLEPPTVEPPAALLARWQEHLSGHAVVFLGDGAVLYREMISTAVPSARVAAPPPLAGAIGRLAAARARTGETIDPSAIRPLYVRRPDAELAREKRR